MRVLHGVQTNARMPQSSRDLCYPRTHLIWFKIVAVAIAKNQIETSVGSLNRTPAVLVPVVFHKNIKGHRRQGETPRVARFGALDPKTVFCLFKAFANADQPGLKIDVPPLQCKEFAAAHKACHPERGIGCGLVHNAG